MFNLILLSLLPIGSVILLLLWKRHYSEIKLALFTAQLATTVERQAPLGEALKNLARDTKDKLLRDAVLQVADDVESGERLSTALSKHPQVFPEVYVRMVEAGEESNNLFDALYQLSDYYRHAEDFKEKILGVVLYPLILAIVVLCVQTFIFLFIVPQFEEMYREMEIKLPLLTACLFFLARYYWLTLFWIWPFGFIIMIYLIDVLIARNQTARFVIDRIKLNIPVIGHINKSAILARFCRTLGVLLKGNVSISRALELVSKVSGNRIMDIAIAHIGMQVAEGEPIAEALYGDRLFPRTLVWMVSVGEKRGDLAQTLINCAEVYKRRTERLSEVLKFFLPPIFSIFIIPLIGFAVAALFLPLIRLMAELGGG